jgi:hypothetical protein
LPNKGTKLAARNRQLHGVGSVKKFLVGAALSLSAMYLGPAFGGATTTTTFLDTTQDFAYSGTNPSSYTGFGFSGTAPTTGDFLGDGFDTEKLTVIRSPGQIEFQYTTSFDGNDASARYADIFLAPTDNLMHAPGTWGLGIALGNLADDFQGAVAAGLYSITGPADYQTSQDIWGPKGTGWVYGGGYVAPDSTENLSPTRVTGGTQLAGWNVISEVHASGETAYPYIVDVLLSAPISTFDSLFNTPDLDIFWGTGDCSNDALFAALDAPAKVPEPLTLSIFVAGLTGAVAMRRRKATSA